MIRRGFTLTEILIVIALIVLIIALAIPAFSLITGARSVDAGENLVSAMMSRARAEAIRTHRLAGVAFFRDESQGRTAMALVVPAADRGNESNEPPGLEQYKGWKERDDAGQPVTYQPGDIVIILAIDNDVAPSAKATTQMFVCKQTATGLATRPPNVTYWGQLDSDALDTVVGAEYQYLPRGVGAQTINDPDPTNTGKKLDRYLRAGLILFDGDGNLMHRQYTILVPPPPPTDIDQTHLFRVMGFDKRTPPLNTTDVGTNATYPLYSQLGVVLYEEEEFKTAGGGDDDPTNNNVALTPAEQGEEQWLDANSLSLMVNRYNGTLVRGE